MNVRKEARLRAGGLAALASVALIAAGCGSSSSSSSAPAATSSPATSTASASSAAAAGTSVGIAKDSNGTYLTGATGRALYLWVADANGKSSCNGACAKVWPPLLTKGSPVAATGVNAGDLGTVTRSDGSLQVTYKGHPLYYFVTDTGAGKTTGEGSNSFGAKWWLVAPSGSALTVTTSAATSKSSAGGSSYGGSSSGGSSSGGSSSGSGWA